MPIIRCKSQKSRSLSEHYLELTVSDDKYSRSAGETMIRWIQRLDNEFPTLNIFALTSVDRLVLMSSNDWTADWSVIIIGYEGHYHVEYLLPENESPWHNAYVIGNTKDFEEAIEMTKLGMKKSRAWTELNIHPS